NYWKRRIEV
nr:Chain A, ChREBP Peptide ASN-TYR-TRP-LYS-ARG-ARG-ILE-GLU-VAL [Homo sapiens]